MAINELSFAATVCFWTVRFALILEWILNLSKVTMCLGVLGFDKEDRCVLWTTGAICLMPR